jgi:hypothetical protein
MTKTKATLGRPVNKKSARQIRLAQLAKKRANGTLKLGRPVEKDSVRQKRIVELETKRADGTLKLGRPVDKTSARQKKLARVARLAKQGIVVKRGRPVGSGKKDVKSFEDAMEALEQKVDKAADHVDEENVTVKGA